MNYNDLAHAYDGIENSEAFTSSYFKRGKYIAQVRIMKSKNRQADGAPTFIAEHDIIWSSEGSEGKAGDRASFVQVVVRDKDGKDQKGGLGRIKAYLQAVTGAQTIDGAGVAMVTHPKNPMRSALVRVDCMPVKTKAGKIIDAPTFDRCEAIDPAELKAMRQAAGLSPELPAVEADEA